MRLLKLVSATPPPPWTGRIYRQTSNIKRTLVYNKIDDHSDVVRASPGRRCSNYIFILDLTPGFNILGEDNCKKRRETFQFGGFGATYIRGLTVNDNVCGGVFQLSARWVTTWARISATWWSGATTISTTAASPSTTSSRHASCSSLWRTRSGRRTHRWAAPSA